MIHSIRRQFGTLKPRIFSGIKKRKNCRKGANLIFHGISALIWGNTKSWGWANYNTIRKEARTVAFKKKNNGLIKRYTKNRYFWQFSTKMKIARLLSVDYEKKKEVPQPVTKNSILLQAPFIELLYAICVLSGPLNIGFLISVIQIKLFFPYYHSDTRDPIFPRS